MEQLIILISKFLAHLLIAYFPLNILISFSVALILFLIFKRKNSSI